MLVYSGVKGVKQEKRRGISVAQALKILLVRLHNCLLIAGYCKILGKYFASFSWNKCLCMASVCVGLLVWVSSLIFKVDCIL